MSESANDIVGSTGEEGEGAIARRSDGGESVMNHVGLCGELHSVAHDVARKE